MKKLLFVFGILLIIVSSANAQKLFSKEWRLQQLGKDSASVAARNKSNDDGVYGNFAKKENAKFTGKSIMDQAGIYLNKSANFQYGALGSAAVSAGLLIGYGCMTEKFELNDEGESKLTGKAKGLIIGGSAFALLAIILEVSAIEYKIKAGKCLRLQANENGAGLAYVF